MSKHNGGAVLRRTRRCCAVAAALLLALLAVGRPALAADTPAARPLRIGVLQFGTVAWTLDTLRHQGFDRAAGITIEIVPMAAPNAAQIALQGGTVDLITSDWLWVARNRAEGRRMQFAPNSSALGGLYVRPDSGITSLADLAGRELGVAGTPVDKSWLFLQAWARRSAGLDLRTAAQPKFAAPPALNALMLRGKLPAVLNFWPYGARLSAAGMTELVSMDTVLKGLGVAQPVPMLGWVFRESWADAHGAQLAAFLDAVARTNAVLRTSDPAWVRLKPLMKAANEAEFIALRDAHRAGIAPASLVVDLPALKKLYALLAELGGSELVGRATALDPTLFRPAHP